MSNGWMFCGCLLKQPLKKQKLFCEINKNDMKVSELLQELIKNDN